MKREAVREQSTLAGVLPTSNFYSSIINRVFCKKRRRNLFFSSRPLHPVPSMSFPSRPGYEVHGPQGSGARNFIQLMDR